MLPGTKFLWWRAIQFSHFPESPLWFGNDFFSKWFQDLETGKILLGLSPESRVDGAQRMSDVLREECGWGVTRWAGAWSWCYIEVWFSHISGLFLHTAFLKSDTVSWYNCLFTIWPRGINLMMDNAFPNEKHRYYLFELCQIIIVFWSMTPISHPLRRLHLGFYIIPINHVSSTIMTFLRKYFHYHLYWQAVHNWFQRSTLSDREPTSAARILNRRDASEFFIKNLMARSYVGAHNVNKFSES